MTDKSLKKQILNTPDFMIIGEAKSGTTSLFNYINQVSENFVSPLDKEIYYFSRFYEKGPQWYSNFFPDKVKEDEITGEATPEYFFHPLCAERIKKDLPRLKFIVLIRNPIDRAYSHYQFINTTQKTLAYDLLTFEQAIEAEENRLSGEEEYIRSTGKYTFNHMYHSYLNRGIYYRQFERWFKSFDRTQFYIIKSEDFFSHPKSTLEKICNFIGVRLNENLSTSFISYNKNEYQEMAESTRNKLRKFFKPFNDNLYELLGQDLGWD